MTDMTPYLCYLLIPVVDQLRTTTGRPVWKRGFALTFLVLMGWSFFTHLRGTTSWEATVGWNGSPVNVDAEPRRLWDFRDPAFLRGLRKSQQG